VIEKIIIYHQPNDTDLVLKIPTMETVINRGWCHKSYEPGQRAKVNLVVCAI